MINFRFHIISLTAVFLALGIGIAMGSTVVSKATVSGLRANLHTIEHNSDLVRDDNRKLSGQVSRAARTDQDLTKLALAPAVADHLTGVPVLLIAAKGVDAQVLDRVQQTLADAGAGFEGTLLVDRRLELKGGNASRLARILGVDEGPELRDQLVAKVAVLLENAARIPSRVKAPDGAALLTALRSAGFVEFEPPDGGSADQPLLALPTGGYRYVVVSGATPDLPDALFLGPLLSALASGGSAPVVAASAATGDAPEDTRLAFVGPLRDDKDLNANLSTVDDLESYPGLLAVVYGLEEVGPDGLGRHGHYGVGKGATALLPSVSG